MTPESRAPLADILVSGIASADLVFPGLARMPALGQEVASEDFIVKPGGAANIATALHRLSLRVTFVSAFGEDVAGRIVTDQLRSLGLDLSSCQVGPDVRTPVSAVLSCGSDRGFATYFGRWDEADLVSRLRQAIPSCRLAYGSIRDFLSYRLHDLARAAGVPYAIDMAWDDTLLLRDIEAIVAGSAIFFANEAEARNLTGRQDPDEALSILAACAPLVVLKLGPAGSLVRQGDRTWRAAPVPVPRVVDTTGAGDLYCAGFLFGFLQGWPIRDCAQWASAAGALAVTFHGGVDAAFTQEAVARLLREAGPI